VMHGLNQVAGGWSQWMAATAWQAALLILLAFVLDRMLRGWAWPQLRHALWIVVGVKLVLPPTLSTPVSVVPALAPDLARVPAVSMGTVGPNVVTWVFLAWAAGALACIAAVGWRVVAQRRALRAGCTPADAGVAALVRSTASQLGLPRVPRVWVHDVAGPAVFGLLRPTIVLPIEVVRGDAAQLRHVLLHELAHVKRRDLWAQAAYALLCAVYWFHPLVHLARRRAATLRELCCDATVAAHLNGDTGSYRATLLRSAARTLLHPIPHVGTAGFFFRRSAILARLAALERPHWKHPVRRAAVTSFFVAALLLLIVPMMGAAAAIGILPEPTLETRLEQARENVARIAADPERAGCLEYRYAYMYMT